MSDNLSSVSPDADTTTLAGTPCTLTREQQFFLRLMEAAKEAGVPFLYSPSPELIQPGIRLLTLIEGTDPAQKIRITVSFEREVTEPPPPSPPND